MLAFLGMTLAFIYKDELEERSKHVLTSDKLLIIAFTLFYLVSNLLFIPLGIPSFISGFAFTWKWGFWLGMPFCMFCNFWWWQIAHIVPFLIGRYLIYDFIYRRWERQKMLYVLNHAIEQEGAWVHFKMRATFLLPHTIMTYTLAISDITLKQFINGNWGVILAAWPFIYTGVCIALLKRDFFIQQRLKAKET